MSEELRVDLVDALARDVFPARGGFASMEYVEAHVDGGWNARPGAPNLVSLVIRLIVWDAPDDAEQRGITDVKEQQVVFAPASTSLERFSAYLKAWCAVLARAFTDATREQLEVMMPHDFVHGDVLKLKTAHTQDDFERAFAQRSRLGRWLTTSSAPPPHRAGDDGARDDDARAAPPPPRERDTSL